ncbi:AMP-binding protein [Streptomyces sp. NPDC006798]|uniref:AMP-binding protein n=1 Tax=Streptomyces sp. NPDC006798 TaxID=3155462 RepID=UPI0033F2FC75
MSAQWGRPLHHVIHAIACTVLGRQSVDGAVRLRADGVDRGRLVLPRTITLSEAARLTGDLVGDAGSVVATTANAGSGLPEQVRLEILHRADGTIAIPVTGSARQADRLRHAWHHPYTAAATVRDVPLVSPDDARDLARWDENLAPVPATTLDATFSRIARALPAATAVAAGEHRLSYAQVEAQASRLAGLLVRSGVQLGEPVVVVSDRPFRAVVEQLAVLKAGAVCLPVGRVTRLRARELTALSGARYVLGDGPGVAPWEPYCRTLSARQAQQAPERGTEGTTPEPSLPRSGFTDVAYCLVDTPDRGRPGARLSAHDAWGSATLARIRRIGRASGEIAVCARPWDPVFVSAMWWAFACGGLLRWHDPAAADAHRSVARHLTGASRPDALLTAEQYARVLAAVDRPADPGTRAVVLTGEPAGDRPVERHAARLPGARLFAEFSGDGAPLPWTVRELPSPGTEPAKAAGDPAAPFTPIGRPAPNVRVRILDESGRALPPGIVGELRAEGCALSCATLPPGGTQPGYPDPLLASGRLARLRADGTLELADARPAPPAAPHVLVRRTPPAVGALRR